MSARHLHPESLDCPAFWAQISAMCRQGRIAQAMLLVTPPELKLSPVLDRLAAKLLCLADDGPCGICAHCVKVLQDQHPDVHYIQVEGAGSTIKIEQIRDLQQIVYQPPQLGQRKLLIINPADAMNQAAASALLKILEEPSDSTLFILVTAAPSLLLPTIMSRCQRLQIDSGTVSLDPLCLGQYYPESSVRATLFAQRFTLLADLDALLAGKNTPCDVAQRWAIYPVADVLWFLYALLAKLIACALVSDHVLETEYQAYMLFAKLRQPERLFVQLDSIQALMPPLQNNIALNPALVLESVLIDFMQGTSSC